MKKTTLLMFMLSMVFGFSQNTVTIDGTKTWNGYVNAFNVSDDSYAFGFGYPVGDLKTVISASSVRISPNVLIWGAEATNAAWFDNPGNPPSNPNKYIEANAYVEDGTLAGSDLTFVGTINENDIIAGYSAIAFIKALDPGSGYATVTFKSVVIGASGTFTVSATAGELSPGYVIQYGFALTGPIIDPANESAAGSIEFTPSSLSFDDIDINNFSAYPNPTQNKWIIESKNTIQSIQVFDILGKNVMSTTPNTVKAELDGSSLRTGLYIAQIRTEYGTESIRLIKN